MTVSTASNPHSAATTPAPSPAPAATIQPRGDWLQTLSGQQLYLLSPLPSQIDIEEIATSLSRLARFLGHTTGGFYSVAQHSVLVSQLVPPELALAGLLHDAHEAYIGDITTPVKRTLYEMPGGYLFKAALDRIVFGLDHSISLRFDLRDMALSSCEVRRADRVALATERRDLMAPTAEVWDCLAGIEPAASRIVALPPEKSLRLFVERFEELTEGR